MIKPRPPCGGSKPTTRRCRSPRSTRRRGSSTRSFSCRLRTPSVPISAGRTCSTSRPTRVVDVASWVQWTDDDAVPGKQAKEARVQLARQEVDGDALRLLYVALTRAKHRVELWWAPTKRSGSSAFGRLLLRSARTGTGRELADRRGLRETRRHGRDDAPPAGRAGRGVERNDRRARRGGHATDPAPAADRQHAGCRPRGRGIGAPAARRPDVEVMVVHRHQQGVGRSRARPRAAAGWWRRRAGHRGRRRDPGRACRSATSSAAPRSARWSTRSSSTSTSRLRRWPTSCASGSKRGPAVPVWRSTTAPSPPACWRPSTPGSDRCSTGGRCGPFRPAIVSPSWRSIWRSPTARR